MGLKRGQKRTWEAGLPKLEGKRKTLVTLTEEIHTFLLEHYPSVSAGLRELAEKEMERRKKLEARQQERQQKQQTAKS